MLDNGSAPPRVSVVMPAYNAAAHVEAAARSVLDQSFADLELIVVDDGSFDQTPQILAAIADSRLVVEHQSNAGPAGARNAGLELARGELIAFQDADDVWLPEKLAKQVALLDARPEIGLVHCDAEFVDADGRAIDDYPRRWAPHRGDTLLELVCHHFLLTPAVVFRRKLLERAGMFDLMLLVGEDYDFFLRLVALAPIDCVEEKLWQRRVVADSLSRRDFALDARTDIATLQRCLRRHPALLAADRPRVLRRLANYHFDYGYGCLEAGRNGEAFGQFVRALRYERSARLLKNLLLCALPSPFRRRLKRPTS